MEMSLLQKGQLILELKGHCQKLIYNCILPSNILHQNYGRISNIQLITV